MSPVVVGRWKFGRGADPNPVIKVTSKVTPSALKEEISYSPNTIRGTDGRGTLCYHLPDRKEDREIRDPLLQLQSWTKKIVKCCVISSPK